MGIEILHKAVSERSLQVSYPARGMGIEISVSFGGKGARYTSYPARGMGIEMSKLKPIARSLSVIPREGYGD